MQRRLILLTAMLASVLTGCATTQGAGASSDPSSFAQQVILVSLPAPLQSEFIADTLQLGTIPGVQDIRIGHPVRFQDPQLDWWIDDYDLAIFIRFDSEDVTAAYGEHPLHNAWNAKWSGKLGGFRALRTVGSGRPVTYE